MFGKLKAATEGTKEYDKAKKAIISKYGQYLNGLDEEVKSLKKVEEAYKAISEAAIQAARDRAIDSATSKAIEAYVKVEQEKLEKIRNLMEKKFGALHGTKFFEKFKKELLSGNGFSEEIKGVIEEFNVTYNDINSSFGAKTGITSKTVNSIDNFVENIRDAKNVLNQELNKIDSILGNHSPEVEPNFTYFERLTADLKIAEEELENMKRASSEISKEQIAGQEAYIAKLKEAMAVIRDAENVEEVKAKKSIEQYDTEIKKLKELQAKTTSKKGYKDEKGDYILGYDDYQKQINDLQRGKEQIIGSLGRDLQKIKDAKKNQLDIVYQLELDIEQARIGAMEEGEKKYAAQRAFALKRDLISVKEKGEALVKAQQEVERIAWEETNKGKSDLEKGVFKPTTENVADLPKALRKELKNLRNSAYVTFIKTNSDYYEQLHDSLVSQINDYQSKEYTLVKEWDKKIKAAEGIKDDTLVKKLKKEKEKALKELEFDEFKKSIDFTSVFGNLDKLSTTALEHLREKLKEYIGEVGNSLAPENLKELMKAFDDLELSLADRKPFDGLKKEFGDYRASCEEVSAAQINLKNVESDSTKSEKDKADAIKRLTDAQNKRRESLVSLTNTINSVGEKGKMVVSAGEEVLGMIESFGVKVPEVLKGTFDGVGQIMDSLASLDLTKPFSVVTGAVGILSGVGKTIGSIFGGGKSKSQRDSERLEKVTNKIAQANEVINSLIDKRIDLIQKATTAEKGYLAEITKTSIDVQKSQLNKQFHSLLGNDILAKKGKNNNLSLKELGISSIEELRDFLSSDELLDYLNNKGYSIRDADKYREIVDAWTKLEEQAEKLGDTLKESLTGISFDEVKDGLDDLLLNADTTMEDISGNFEDYMKKAILNIVKTNTLSGALKKWYDNFYSYLDARGGKLTEDDINELRRQYENVYANAQNQVNDLLDIAGISLEKNLEEATGLQGAVRKEMTEETGSELTGLFRSYYDLCKLQLGINTESLEVQKSCRLDVIKLLEVAYLIEHNTSRTVEELEKVNEELGLVRYNLQKPLSSTQTARSLGV